MKKIYYMYANQIPPLCECGCGEPVERSKLWHHRWNRFLNGHNQRNKKFKMTPEQLEKSSVSHSQKPSGMRGKRYIHDENDNHITLDIV